MEELAEYWLSLIVRSHNILLAAPAAIHVHPSMRLCVRAAQGIMDTIVRTFSDKVCYIFCFARLLFGYFSGNKLFSSSALTQPVRTWAFSSWSLVLLLGELLLLLLVVSVCNRAENKSYALLQKSLCEVLFRCWRFYGSCCCHSFHFSLLVCACERLCERWQLGEKFRFIVDIGYVSVSNGVR